MTGLRFTRRAKLPTLVLALAVLPVGWAHGQVAVRAYTEKDSLSVGERFPLVVAADHGSGVEPIFPLLPPDSAGRFLQFQDLLVLRLIDRGSSESGGVVTDSVIYEATTFALDTSRVGSVPVLLVSGSDTSGASSDPFWIPVRSVVPADASDILDLAPIAEFPSPVWPWIAFLLALISAVAVFIYWYRKRPTTILIGRDRVEPHKSPIDEALDRLEVLDRASYVTETERKSFFVELSDVVRTYLARRLSVPALETTSRELGDVLLTLVAQGELPEDLRATVLEILDVCDLAKFADIFPPETQGRSAVATVTQLVKSIEDFLKPELEEFDETDESYQEDTVPT